MSKPKVDRKGVVEAKKLTEEKLLKILFIMKSDALDYWHTPLSKQSYSKEKIKRETREIDKAYNQLKELVEWYFDNAPICPYTVCQQQKPMVSEEKIEELLCMIWHKDRCGDSTFESDDLRGWLKEIGVEVEDE